MKTLRLGSCALLFLLVNLWSCAQERSISLLQSQSAGTRYPIVLHHGLLGFNRILFIDYFYDVRATLERQGYVVRTTNVSILNSIEVRAAELAEQIDAILAETHAEKVNIIAHSMGGLDARHVISVLGYGDRVASLITLGTPHRGTPVADLGYSVLTADSKRILAALERLFLGDPDLRPKQDFDSDINLNAALWNLSEEYLRSPEFVSSHQDDDRVVYESFAGNGNFTGIGTRDRVDPLLSITYAYLRVASGANDGMVPVESARHGLDRGVLPADHINMIGQLFGETSHAFRHREFYSDLVSNLKARGF